MPETAVDTTDTLSRASLLKEKLVQYRRHLHANPELSFKESDTHNFIEKELRLSIAACRKTLQGLD